MEGTYYNTSMFCPIPLGLLGVKGLNKTVFTEAGNQPWHIPTTYVIRVSKQILKS
jgi:hypothetical protein